jgi:F-type H+-transporting ATPase subunit delta
LTSASHTPSIGLSRRYAAALYELADEQGALDDTIDQMDKLGRLIAEAPDLRRLIESRTIDARHAAGAMDAVLAEQGFSPLVRHFVGVVTANRRLTELPALIGGFAAYVADKRGVITAEVTTAHPLTDTQKAQLAARLATAGYGRVALREQVDPSLLGGMTLKIGARLYDTSLKSRLQRLNYAMKEVA